MNSICFFLFDTLDIVTAATNRVTIVIQKKVEMDDYQSATETSISSMTKDVSSFVYNEDQPNSFKRNKSSTSTSIEGTETTNDNLGTSREGNVSSEVTVNKLSRREEMIGDGLLISENSEITEPVSILINESWKLSGAIVVNVKKMNHSDEPGFRMGMKETSNGRVLFVSDIIPSSPFAKTPLRIGDIILSINNISLHENADVVNAYSALGKSGNRITVVAKKGQESLNDFLLVGRREPVIQEDEIILNDRKSTSTPSSTGTGGTVRTTKSGTTTINSSEDEATFNDSNSKEEENICQGHVGNSPQSVKITIPFHPPSRTDHLEFDEVSYGASLYGYNSSSSIRIVKDASSTEDVGFEIREANTEWGRLITVAKITPHSLVSTTHLKVGDAILAINGVDFRKNPDAERAASLLKISQGEVCIEYQKISRYLPTVPVDLCEQKEEVSVKSKDLASVGNSSEVIGRSGQVALPILEEAEVNGKSLSINSSITNDQHRGREVHSTERSSKGQENSNRHGQHSMKMKRQKIWITVTRGKGQKVGINLASLNEKLVVTKLSSSGLLRNAPLVPGDTILSINKVDFRLNPDAKEAYLLVNDAPKHVTFEILKTGYDSNDKSNDVGTKTCVLGSFLCVAGRRRRVNDSHPLSTKFDENKDHKTGYDTPL
jgi:C-terminal processing protease CtpA/Prc